MTRLYAFLCAYLSSFIVIGVGPFNFFKKQYICMWPPYEFLLYPRIGFFRLPHKCPTSCQMYYLNIWIFLLAFLWLIFLLIFNDDCFLALNGSDLHALSNPMVSCYNSPPQCLESLQIAPCCKWYL